MPMSPHTVAEVLTAAGRRYPPIREVLIALNPDRVRTKTMAALVDFYFALEERRIAEERKAPQEARSQ